MDGGCPDADALQAWMDGPVDTARRDALIEHVADCAPCRELTAALAHADATTADTPPAMAAAAPGARVGRFLLRRICGRGGMGVVFEAYDPEVDRVVALKLVTAAAGIEGRARFVREARALARLRHPNVVALHEVGEHRDRPYLVMDWIADGDLRRWLREAPRSWRDILGVIIDVGRGLAALHDAGMLHRDVKPDNVLIDGRGPQPRGLIGDLGLVAIADADTFTRSGTLLGTPRYMAPEQLGGAAVDVRTDVFGLAVTGLEAIRAATAVGAAPPAVLAVLRRGGDPDPAHRYVSVMAFLRELERAGKRARRRAVLGRAGPAMAAAVAAITFLAWTAIATRQPGGAATSPITVVATAGVPAPSPPVVSDGARASELETAGAGARASTQQGVPGPRPPVPAAATASTTADPPAPGPAPTMPMDEPSRYAAVMRQAAKDGCSKGGMWYETAASHATTVGELVAAKSAEAGCSVERGSVGEVFTSARWRAAHTSPDGLMRVAIEYTGLATGLTAHGQGDLAREELTQALPRFSGDARRHLERWLAANPAP